MENEMVAMIDRKITQSYFKRAKHLIAHINNRCQSMTIFVVFSALFFVAVNAVDFLVASSFSNDKNVDAFVYAQFD